MSSLRPFFGEDVDSNGLATTATPTEGDIVVPRWDVLVPRCSSEPMVVETAPAPPWSGKYLHFPHARAYGIFVILACRFIIMLLLIAFLQRRHLLTNRRIPDPWILPGLTLCSVFLSL